MSEEDELEQSGSLTQQSPKRFDLVERMNEYDIRIATVNHKLDAVLKYVEGLEEHIQALTRAQMNRPMIDHGSDAVAGTR